jgi:formimidoylglutamate deiminase
VKLQLGADGRVRAAELPPTDSFTAPLRIEGLVLPGIPNLHSHAFQRAMAGLAERRVAGQDDFWSWRETMYHFAGRIGPDQLKPIAAQLYMELLEQGYTEVCEFHYLHQQPDGRPHAEPAAMCLALIEAAREVGIGLTLLPTLYLSGHLDGRPLSPRQARFGHASVEHYLRLVERLLLHEDLQLHIGIALHSLRAVPPEALSEVLGAFAAAPFCTPGRRRPIHIHIAEQRAEVEDCLALRGARPVQWLLDHAAVDEHWSLVHATHLALSEIHAIAASGASVTLCPTTEANLGDGVFPLLDFVGAGGVFGIGSDSHVSTSPVEELRWLEYGQRLRRHSRIVAADTQGRVAEALLWQALRAGDRVARGDGGSAWLAGRRLDLVVLDDSAPELAALPPDRHIDGWIFSGNRPLVREVMVGGRWQVREGRHRAREGVERAYLQVCRELQSG